MHSRTLLFLLLCFLPACGRAGEVRSCPQEAMRQGDLVFRCGRGMLSHAVLAVEQKGVYSHVGVLVQEPDGSWKVAHCVPAEREFDGDFDRVKLEPLERFCAPGRAATGCFVHVDGALDPQRVAAICDEARRAFRDSVRFDHDYDLADSSALYCTEFVWRLYKHGGVDLSEGRRRSVNLPGIHGDVLLPEHLLQYKDNTIYHQF